MGRTSVFSRWGIVTMTSDVNDKMPQHWKWDKFAWKDLISNWKLYRVQLQSNGIWVPENIIACPIQNADSQHKVSGFILFLCNYYLFYFAFFTTVFWYIAQAVSLSLTFLCV